MHALIKSEAYYLTHDPVIRRWEDKPNKNRAIDNIRITLEYTGRVYMRIFRIIIRENLAFVTTAGYTFALQKVFVMAHLAEIVELRGIELQKFLNRNKEVGKW